MVCVTFGSSNTPDNEDGAVMELVEEEGDPVFGALVAVGEVPGWWTDDDGIAGGGRRGTPDDILPRGVHAIPPGPTTKVSSPDWVSDVVVVSVEDSDASTEIVVSTKISVIVWEPIVPTMAVSWS